MPIEGRSRRVEGEEISRMSKFQKAMISKDLQDALISRPHELEDDEWKEGLLWASSSGHAEFINNFMNKAPPGCTRMLKDAKDDDGFTCLHRAVVAGQKKVAKVILKSRDRDAELFDILHARTPEGWTSLHLAVVVGDDVVMKNLINAYKSLGRTVPDSEWVSPEWTFSDAYWLTPLHYAVLGMHYTYAERNRLAEMKQLLEWEGYDPYVNCHDYNMRTPMHMAAYHVGNSIECIVNHPKVDINAMDCCMHTPLHWAASRNANAVRCLFSQTEKTIRATEKNIRGESVFHLTFHREENSLYSVKKFFADNQNRSGFKEQEWKWLRDVRIDGVGAKRDIRTLLLTRADVKEEVEGLYRDRTLYVNAANAMLVGAALIASVTYRGWLQPPIGDSSRKAAHGIRIFWVTNSLSFYFSISAMMAGARITMPRNAAFYNIAVEVRRSRKFLTYMSIPFIISIVFVLIAFGASGFASLTSIKIVRLTDAMLTTTIIGALVCTFYLILFLYGLPGVYSSGIPFSDKMEQSILKLGQWWKPGLCSPDMKVELTSACSEAKADFALTRFWKPNEEQPEIDTWSLSHPESKPELSLLKILTKAREDAAPLRKKYEGGWHIVMWINEYFYGAKYGSLVGQRGERLKEYVGLFEKAYETSSKSITQEPKHRTRYQILSHLSPRGVHHWIRNYNCRFCREQSIRKDEERWLRIHNKVTVKKSALEKGK